MRGAKVVCGDVARQITSILRLGNAIVTGSGLGEVRGLQLEVKMWLWFGCSAVEKMERAGANNGRSQGKSTRLALMT
jgi:hypothetical protein